jgi:O-acetylhomoserine/O-acetylserine sulfhydrylase-like pyridoxal-dependent enzyme
MTDDRSQGFATRAIHCGYDPLTAQGALVPPIYLTSTFAFADVAEGQRRFRGEEPGYIYSRVGNPTVSILESRLASLEGGEARRRSGPCSSRATPSWPTAHSMAAPSPCSSTA